MDAMGKEVKYGGRPSTVWVSLEVFKPFVFVKFSVERETTEGEFLINEITLE